jgi:uncharacterized RDD family membrane protein YckC/tetratricopeptide (TPR) repeat protein
LRTHPAPNAKRALSWFVDLVVLAVAFTIVAAAVETLFPIGPDGDVPAVADAINLVALTLLPVLYLGVAERGVGQSVGKRIAGIRVAATDGRPRLGLGPSLLRGVARWLSVMPLLVGYVAALTGRKRAWHDLLTGTVVVAVGSPVVMEDKSALPAPLLAPALAPPPQREAPTRRGECLTHAPDAPDMWGPSSIDLRRLAAALEAGGHCDEATWLRVRSLRPHEADDPDVWGELAVLVAKHLSPVDAFGIANEWLVDHPNHPGFLSARCLAQAQLGQLDAAIASGEKALHSDRASVAAREALAAALVGAKRHDRALEVLDSLRSEGVETVDSIACRARIALEAGEFSEAEHLGLAALALDPLNVGVRILTVRAIGRRRWTRERASARAFGMVRNRLRAALVTDPCLAEQAALLVAGLEGTPQIGALRDELLELPVLSVSPVRRYVRKVLAILSGVAALLLVLGPTAREAHIADDVSRIVIGLEPWSVAIVAITSIVSALRLRAHAAQMRALDERSRSWLRFARATHEADAVGHGTPRSYGSPRSRAKDPTPPAKSVLAAPTLCHCATLRALWFDLAARHARLHLTVVRRHELGLDELLCPETLTSWISVDRGNGPHLCRVALAGEDEPILANRDE